MLNNRPSYKALHWIRIGAWTVLILAALVLVALRSH